MLLLLLVLAVTVGFIVVVAVVVLRYNKQWVLPWSCMSFGGWSISKSIPKYSLSG